MSQRNRMLTGKYAAFYQSDQFGLLQEISNELIKSWREQAGTGVTIEEYGMTSFQRDSRIEGVTMLINRIASLGSKSEDDTE